MSGQNAGDHHSHSGTDAAALFGHFNGNRLELKDKTFLVVWGPKRSEDQRRGLGGPPLEGVNEVIHQVRGDGHHEEQKQQREEAGPKGLLSEKQKKGPLPDYKQRGDLPGDTVVQVEVLALRQAGPVAYKADRQHDNPGRKFRFNRGKNPLPPGINQVSADQRD